MQREIELLRRETELMRTSPRLSLSTISRILSIKNVSDLLSEYADSGDDFERWLRLTY